MTAPMPEWWSSNNALTQSAAKAYHLLKSDAPLPSEDRIACASVLDELVMAFEDSTPPILRRMFADEAIFWCTHWEDPPHLEVKDNKLIETSGARNWPAIAIICNDLFAWGVSDCEEIDAALWEEVAAVHKAHGTWGLQVWVARRRKQSPQAPVLRDAGWQTAAAAMGWSEEEAACA